MENKSERLEILATPSDTGDICYFTLSEILLDEGQLFCSSSKEARGSILFENLFEIEGVLEAVVEENRLIVKKTNKDSWVIVGKKIGEAIRDIVKKRVPIFSEEFLKKNLKNSKSSSNSSKVLINEEAVESELGMKIQKVIDLKISPSLSAHGGSVQLVDIQNFVLYLNFMGGCQGCSQVSSTVKDGIEQVLKLEVPEIIEIRDITDHALGDKPYFS